ncbi:MAG: hypothetical protein HYV53_01795 [Parcubacteria group bacterium]|nr:hypothetical protein [Parcubacteria group bacterium]
MSYNSTFLFARPSFVEGMARVIDLGSTMQIYNSSKSEKEADVKALKKDWEAVGEDVAYAIKEYERKK